MQVEIWVNIKLLLVEQIWNVNVGRALHVNSVWNYPNSLSYRINCMFSLTRIA